MERRARLAWLLAIILVSFPAVMAEPEQQDSAHACPDLQQMEGIGPVCPREGGLYEVYAPDGRSLGFTHGPDPLCLGCEEGSASTQGSTAVHCVSGSAGEYFVHVIYARAHDDADRYSTMAGTIRTLVGNANAMVDDAAIATGDRLAIRVKCASGIVVVENVVLPTSRSSATFSTIVNDLANKGYADHRVKYWIYYDDSSACSCAGAALMYGDDSDSVNNLNNGPSNAEPLYAISFDSNSVRTMLHELGHTLGAVQDGAPYSTEAGHCYDGRDTMCYNDGGPNGHLYSTGYCGTEVFDCNKNTYCHANPAIGSYLDTHWQACSRHSRFLQFADNEAPIMQSLSCSPSPSFAEESVTCSFSASDSNAGVYYTVDWGDGTTTRVPDVGTVTPGTTQSASHAWAAQGEYVVSVTATDSGTPSLTSAPLSVAQSVGPANEAPVIDSFACLPLAPLEGETVTCEFRANDSAHNLSFNISWGDGSAMERVPASGTVPSGSTVNATHAYARGGEFAVNLTATDDGRPAKSATQSVNVSVTEVNTPPEMLSLTCPTTLLRVGQTVSCSFRAADDSSGVRYAIEWGDGTITYVPSATGYVAPGGSHSATHAYSTDGAWSVNVSATDDFSPPATSGTLQATIRVQTDQEPPSISIRDPARATLYRGCAQKTSIFTGDPVFFERGCVRASVTDPSGVARVEVVIDGIVRAEDTEAPYELDFDLTGTRLSGSVGVRAYDALGNHRMASLTVHMVA